MMPSGDGRRRHDHAGVGAKMLKTFGFQVVAQDWFSGFFEFESRFPLQKKRPDFKGLDSH
jgi:hypothetical protein